MLLSSQHFLYLKLYSFVYVSMNSNLHSTISSLKASLCLFPLLLDHHIKNSAWHTARDQKDLIIFLYPRERSKLRPMYVFLLPFLVLSNSLIQRGNSDFLVEKEVGLLVSEANLEQHVVD